MQLCHAGLRSLIMSALTARLVQESLQFEATLTSETMPQGKRDEIGGEPSAGRVVRQQGMPPCWRVGHAMEPAKTAMWGISAPDPES